MQTEQRVYRKLLVLYPKAFRQEFAADLAQTFSDLVHDDGAPSAWRRIIVDFAVSVPRSRLEAIMKNQRSNVVLNTLIVTLFVAWLGTLALGAVVGLPLLAVAVVLGVTQRSRLARSLQPERPASLRRSRLLTAAIFGLIALGTIASWIYHINHYKHLGDTTVMVHNLIGLPTLVAAACYLVAGLRTPRSTPSPVA